MMRFLTFLFLSVAPLQMNVLLAEEGPPKKETLSAPAQTPQLLDFKKIFTSAPVIYSILSMMSVASMVIWLYSLSTFRTKDIMPEAFLHELRALLAQEKYDEAKKLCSLKENLLASLIKAGLTTRNLGPQVMIDAMKSEGKRASTAFWQRLSLLNDIVIIAPMLGLLGTVIGMFYAFYDVNRSIESMNALFDGLGIAVGTTVMGLIVAILAMMFYTTLKYRVVQTLSLVENEALTLSALIESKHNRY
ncbi:MAG: MotA/TolQ/ExbB proton channel family protein [Chlamydiota bacterium]